jgi:LmbE family N-acetylglucosaminyl deacetylase
VTAAAPWAADARRLDATQAYASTQARQFWQRAAWTRDANVTNDTWSQRPLPDALETQGTLTRSALDAADVAAMRRAEDERYAYFVEASVVDLDLPDAIHRGYEGDDAVLGPPADDDEAPIDLLRREIMRLEPQQVYVPLGVGGHVDHRLCRDAVVALLDEPPSWVMPGPDLAGRVSFYEDFPYAWWGGFSGVRDAAGLGLQLPDGLAVEPRYADISDQLERKSAGIRLYASQVPRLFESEQGLLDDVAGYAARVAEAGGIGTGAAERYWGVVRT